MNWKETECYCDQDGVLAAFVDPSILLHGRADLLTDPNFPNLYDYWIPYMGLSDAQFWKPITDLGAKFWADLPKLAWADTLVYYMERIDPAWRIATKPPYYGGAEARAGKHEWIEKYYPGRVSHMTVDKTDLSGPGRLLFDDSEDNCIKWRKRGGMAVLVPGRTNRLFKHAQPLNVLNHVAKQLRALGYEV